MTPATYRSPWLSEEVLLYRDSVRRFVREELSPAQARWREQGHADASAWGKAGEVGVLLPEIPTEYGGGGGTFAHEAVVIEELARAGVHFGTHIQSMVARYIVTYATPQQKQRWLPALAQGERVAAIAMTEPDAGSDLQGIKTVARREGAFYVLNGSKTFVTNGSQADLICVAVKTDPAVAGPHALSLIMIERESVTGYRVGAPLGKIGRHGQDTCEIFLEDVRVPAENLLGGEEGRGFVQMMEQLPYERLQVAVSAVIVAERAVALTMRYAKERLVFGKPLLDMQNTRFVLAECRTEAHVGRVFIDTCIMRHLAGDLDAVAAAMAKYWLTDVEARIVDACVQLHGGYGYMEEYAIARMWADSRPQRIYAGSNEVMKEIIGWSL